MEKKNYCLKEVEENNYIIIKNKVYDISKFINKHPGGPFVLKKFMGKDVTKEFKLLHKKGTLSRFKHLHIGYYKNPTYSENCCCIS